MYNSNIVYCLGMTFVSTVGPGSSVTTKPRVMQHITLVTNGDVPREGQLYNYDHMYYITERFSMKGHICYYIVVCVYVCVCISVSAHINVYV